MIGNRIRGIGILTQEDALRLGVVGPVARGSGLAVDVRKESPYAAYGKVDFNVITCDGGDLYARTCVRLHEITESIKILRQVVRDMPDGPYRAHMTRIFPSEAVTRSETPRCEVIYYIRTNSTEIPERLKWRVPSHMNCSRWASCSATPRWPTRPLSPTPSTPASHARSAREPVCMRLLWPRACSAPPSTASAPTTRARL